MRREACLAGVAEVAVLVLKLQQVRRLCMAAEAEAAVEMSSADTAALVATGGKELAETGHLTLFIVDASPAAAAAATSPMGALVQMASFGFGV